MAGGQRRLVLRRPTRSTWLPVPMPRRLMIGLENTGNAGGITPCGAASQPLRQRDRELVVDPAMRRIPLQESGILGRDQHVLRAGDVCEILEPPGIGLADRHGSQPAT